MPEETLEVEGLDDLKRFVNRFVSTVYLAAAEAGMTAALMLLLSKIPPYPPPPAEGEWWRLATQKQKNWFWWKVKEGTLDPDWGKRTGTLGRQFTYDVQRIGVDILGVFGTATPYAPWVVGPDRSEAITVGGVQMWQAPIHAGRWWQFHKIVEENLDEAYAEMTEATWAALDKAYQGTM